MRKKLYQKWTALIITSSFGSLYLFGCVTDKQFVDFVSTNVIRTFFQTFGSAFQAAFVSQQGG